MTKTTQSTNQTTTDQAGMKTIELPEDVHARVTAAATATKMEIGQLLEKALDRFAIEWEGINLLPAPLRDLMAQDAISPKQLKAVYVNAQHFPASLEPHDLPGVYVEEITKPENWERLVKAARGQHAQNI